MRTGQECVKKRQVCRHTRRLSLAEGLAINDYAPNCAPVAPHIVSVRATTPDVADSTTAWTATIDASVPGVVAIYKLAALPVVLGISSPTSARAIAINAL